LKQVQQKAEKTISEAKASAMKATSEAKQSQQQSLELKKKLENLEKQALTDRK
jgi:hypothetical protein